MSRYCLIMQWKHLMRRIDIRRRPCVAQRNTQSRNVPWEQSVLCQMGRAANFALPPRGAVGGLGSSLRFPRPPFGFFEQVSSHPLLAEASQMRCDNSTPSSTDPSSPNDSEGSGNTHGISSGAIGGIVGGILGSFLLLALAIFTIRKRKQWRDNELDVEEAAAHPYTQAIPSSETQDELNSTPRPTILTTSKHAREQSSTRFPPSDSPGPSTSQSPSLPNMGYTTGAGGPVAVDMAAFSALVDRLNRAISPRMSREAPPSYER